MGKKIPLGGNYAVVEKPETTESKVRILEEIIKENLKMTKEILKNLGSKKPSINKSTT
jgi:hypothetical protein